MLEAGDWLATTRRQLTEARERHSIQAAIIEHMSQHGWTTEQAEQLLAAHAAMIACLEGIEARLKQRESSSTAVIDVGTDSAAISEPELLAG
jgi:hypothetical protein